MSELFDFRTLFGENLITKSGSVQTNAHLRDGFVGLYFSAHWCGPCRSFTPLLANFYNEMKSTGTKFEFIFVSSDRDQSSFDQYYGEMPWAALPFSERALKTKLSSKFKVQGIPKLVMIGPDGTLITAKARESVESDPEGFPWFPTTLVQDLGNTFMAKSGSVPIGNFDGKYLGLYFSARWCGPCRNFTPKLIKYYNDRKASGKDDFEIVFVSSDHDLSGFNEYFSTMPWLALPYSEREKANTLSSRFDLEGVPKLVILDPERNIVSTIGVENVQRDPTGAKFPYLPELVEDLSVTSSSFNEDFNSCPTFIAFVESLDDGQQTASKEAIKPVAETYAKAAGGPKMIFFISPLPSGISEQLRDLTKTKSRLGRLYFIILDIPGGGFFYVSENFEDVTTDSVTSFVESYFSKSLTQYRFSR